MSKLTVSPLFDTVQSVQRIDRFPLQPGPAPAGREIVTHLRSEEHAPSAGLMDGAQLLLCLRSVFDPKRDRLWSTFSEMQHHGGLAAALGLAHSRDSFAQEHWVVVVLNEREISAALETGELDCVAGLRRFLVIWADDDPHFHASRRLPDRMSSTTGIAQIGPLTGLDSEALAPVLAAIKALNEPALLHLQIRRSPAVEGERWEPKEPRSSPFLTTTSRDANKALATHGPLTETCEVVRRIDPPHGTASAMRAALDVVARCARTDRRLLPVNLISDRACREIGRPFAEPFLRPPGRAGIDWYAGLVAGGCRPILVTDGSGAPRWEALLMHEACERRLPLTLVDCRNLVEMTDAVSGAPTATDRAAWPFLPVTLPVAAAGTTTELAAILDLAAGTASPLMVVVSRRLSEPAHYVLAARPPAGFGRGQCLCEGADVALVAWGAALKVARRVAFELARWGLEASVVNPVFMRPLDEELIALVARRARWTLVIEDPSLPSDLMLGVLRGLSEGGQTLPFARVAIDDEVFAGNEDSCVARIVERCQGGLASPAVVSAEPLRRAPAAPPIRPLPAADAERRAVFDRQLSADVSRWIEAYEGIGKRDLYLWRWARRGVELTTLPCVAPESVEHVCDTKVLSIVLCVLLDDIADQHGRGEFLSHLLGIVFDQRGEGCSSLSADERRYAQVAHELTREYGRRIQAYPYYQDYHELLRYDEAQFANTLRYSHLLNRNASFLNLAEHDLYLPHNMHMMSFATLDLMCSHGFARENVGAVREAAWHGQCMGRIGNLLSTWRRELAQKDLTSGIFARALATGDLTIEQIVGGDSKGIENRLRGGKHEYYFIRCWQHHRDCLEAALGRLRGVGLKPWVEGHDRFFQMHLASQGLI